MRGEYKRRAQAEYVKAELPPRARRILRWGNNTDSEQGTTSACAENTADTCPPRIALIELPPRARRIPGCPLHLEADSGTTSACAENTSHRHARPCPNRNYLRVRGEYAAILRKAWLSTELPPRARRIRDRRRARRIWVGTTSACAENTLGRRAWRRTAGNYLRVRGEYIIIPK